MPWSRESERIRGHRLQAIVVLGGICVRCGFSDVRALQIDHIDGNGYGQHGGMHGKGRPRAVYARIAKGDREGFQLLCANCNWIKRAENREDGHRRVAR